MAHEPETERRAPSDLEVLQKTVGARVREERVRAHLRQSELGALIGSGQSHVFLIEDGQINITLKTLVKLANVFKIEPIDLLLDDAKKAKLAASAVKELGSLLQAAKVDLASIDKRIQQAEHILTNERENLGSPPLPET